MDFGTQIRSLRKEQNLTQEQFAEKLSITRQAVSNWENNRNLPDIEMLIQMSTVFCVTLDQLILGGTEMNNMTEKLIEDGSEARRTKMYFVSICIGGALMALGLISFIIKAMSVEYVDANGILHENFFLILAGYMLLFSGAIIILSTGIRYLANRHSK